MRMRLALLGLLCLAPRAWADEAGRFDYYVLALSWSPTWCAIEGSDRGAGQCEADAGFGWILHGLWPQYESGYPEYCDAQTGDPTRAETAAMADIMGSAGLAWYQWKKHGRCAGLAPETYFDRARAAFDAVAKPARFRSLDAPVRLPVSEVEAAFLSVNPALSADTLTITCRNGRVQEARICLSRGDLSPRPCGADVARDCRATDALMAPIR